MGKTIGVIGLGAIGVMVANSCQALGMNVIGYDPYISISAAWGLSRAVKKANSLEEMLGKCDYLTIHVPLMEKTMNYINEDNIKLMKDGVRLINLSRGGLVNTSDVIKELEKGKIAKYVTDFPDENLLSNQNVICIPHLGASTPESEENCAMMAANEVIEYLESGNITNSVNFPDCSQPMSSLNRLCVAHKNVPNMVGQITTVLASGNINILNMLNKSKNGLAYTILDTDDDISQELLNKVENINDILNARIVK